jgi:hypothetical protein
MVLMFAWDVYGDQIGQHVTLRREENGYKRMCLGQVVEALCCKLEGYGFDSPRYYWNFKLTVILLAVLWPWG